MAEETITIPIETVSVKSGWKTTEFWTSIATAISGVLFLAGYFTPNEANEIITAVEKISGSIMIIGPTIAYAISRGRAKQGTIDYQALISALSAVVPKTTSEKK